MHTSQRALLVRTRAKRTILTDQLAYLAGLRLETYDASPAKMTKNRPKIGAGNGQKIKFLNFGRSRKCVPQAKNLKILKFLKNAEHTLCARRMRACERIRPRPKAEVLTHERPKVASRRQDLSEDKVRGRTNDPPKAASPRSAAVGG